MNGYKQKKNAKQIKAPVERKERDRSTINLLVERAETGKNIKP